MSAKNDRLVSPLTRAKGLGSAGEGVHHWLQERIAGALLIPFCLWIVWSVMKLRAATYADFTLWLQNPLNAILLLIFILASFFHGAMGLQVVIEDYTTSHAKKLLLVIANKLVFSLLAVASVFSVLKVAL